MTHVKICGLTRPDDTAVAVAAGARYVGVVFADSPRRVDPRQANDVLAPARAAAEAVGVFGPAAPEEVARIAAEASLDVVQLHGDPSADDIRAVRTLFPGRIWAAHRVRGSLLTPEIATLADAADGVVLDAHDAGRLGGTGIPLDWERLAGEMEHLHRGRAAFVLAGGLRSSTVAEAVRLLAPDVVDVSSGVERAPGIKDHDAIHAFTAAVHAAEAAPRR